MNSVAAMANKGKIVFFLPSYASKEATPPLALISLAGPLVKAGYDVRIIDTAIEQDPVGAVLEQAEGALCLGISLITGPMIRGAVEAGRAVKQRFPRLPIVLGGMAPLDPARADPGGRFRGLRRGQAGGNDHARPGPAIRLFGHSGRRPRNSPR